MMTVCGYLVMKEHHWVADYVNYKSGQYGGYELPCLRSALFTKVHSHNTFPQMLPV